MQEDYNDVEKKVSWFGYKSIIFNLLKALTLGMSTYLMFSISQVDTYIAALLGLFVGIIPFFMIMYISDNKNGEDIIDLNIRLFGKIFGNILNIILNIVFIFLSVLVLFNLSQFIGTQYIPDTSPVYIKLLILLAVMYTSSKGLSTIAKVNQFIAYTTLGLFLLSICGLISKVNISNILPICANGSMPIIKSTIIYAISSIAPLFLITIIPKKNIDGNKYSKKGFLIFYIISSLIVVFIIFFTIAIQGINLINIYRFPEYVVLREFSLFTIIERVEKTLSLEFVFNVIMFMIFSFYFVIESIKKVMKNKKDKSYLSWIIGIICLIITSNIFKNELALNVFISKYLMYILIIGIFIPIIITFIGVIIDNHSKKSTSN